jgi:hypothetical protein
LVITRPRSTGEPATRPCSIDVRHSWADPPTAVCGQVGEYPSGVSASPRRSDRKRSTEPAVDNTSSWLSKTPPAGTRGRMPVLPFFVQDLKENVVQRGGLLGEPGRLDPGVSKPDEISAISATEPVVPDHGGGWWTVSVTSTEVP